MEQIEGDQRSTHGNRLGRVDRAAPVDEEGKYSPLRCIEGRERETPLEDDAIGSASRHGLRVARVVASPSSDLDDI